MKNLQKVLALILVVAILMGFATVASATDYTDDSSINYKEAVEVMSLIGVINGYTDNTFRPAANVTRAQMAKMVAYIIAGGEDVGSLYESANTFTDCTTHWAKGYIAYASKTGFVAGVGNGKFNPDGSVTGVQAAKMLLCALGYSADYEEYTGSNWTVNVLNDANAVGLLDDLGSVNMSEALSREAAAQMMFNALQANMVEYSSGGMNITTSDGTVINTSASTASEVSNASSNDYRSDSEASDDVMQLCEKYFSDLSLDVDYDDFGRPANIWEYDDDSVTCTQKADLTYTTEVDGDDLYSDIGKTVMGKIQASSSDYTVNYSEDGADSEEDYVPNLSTLTKTDDGTYFGTGMLTEIFIDNDSKTVDVVMINTYLAQVTDIDDDDEDDLVLTIESPDGLVSFNDLSEDDSGLNLSSFEEDDYVLVTAAEGDIVSIVAATSVNGEMSTYKTGSSVTLGGTKYALAVKFDDADDMIGSADFDSTYTLFLDSYGNAIGAVLYEEAASSASYLYVSDSVSEAYGAVSGDAYVKVAATFTDGTSKVAYLYVKNASKSTATYYLDGSYKDVTDADDPIPAGWYSYTTNSDGEYKLSTVASQNSTSVSAFQYAASSLNYSGTAKISTGDATLTATSSSKLNLVDSSKTYTGYKNFPDIDKLDIDAGTALYIKASKTGTTLSAIYIYGEDGVSEVATIAYFVGLVGSDSNGELYEFYVDGASVEYYDDGDNMDTFEEGDIVSLDIDDDGAVATAITSTKYDDTYGNYKVLYGEEIYDVEGSDYFTIYDDKSEGEMFYLENDDEDIVADIYNVKSSIKTDSLAKRDDVTIVYLADGSDYYAVAVFITG